MLDKREFVVFDRASAEINELDMFGKDADIEQIQKPMKA